MPSVYDYVGLKRAIASLFDGPVDVIGRQAREHPVRLPAEGGAVVARYIIPRYCGLSRGELPTVRPAAVSRAPGRRRRFSLPFGTAVASTDAVEEMEKRR